MRLKHGTSIALYLTGLAGTFVIAWHAGKTAGTDRQSIPSSSAIIAPAETLAHSVEPDTTANANPALASDFPQRLRELANLGNSNARLQPRYTKEAYKFARTLPFSEFPRTLDLLSESNDEWGNNALRDDLVSWWMEHDARAAVTYFLALPETRRKEIATPAIEAWAHVDHDGLLNWLNSLSQDQRETFTDQVYAAIGKALAREDPALAFSMLSELTRSGHEPEGYVYLEIIREWVGRNPHEAAAKIQTFPPGPTRNSALAELFSRWVRNDPEAAREWLAQIEDPELAEHAREQFRNYAPALDPETMRAYIEGAKSITAGESTGIYRALKKWFSEDSEAVIRYVRSQSQSPIRDTILAHTIDLLLEKDPLRASEIFLSESSFRLSDRFNETAISILSALNAAGKYDESLKLLTAIPASSFDIVAESSVGNIYYESGAKHAIEIGLRLPAGPGRQHWLNEAFRRLSFERNPQEAASLLARVPEGPERETVLDKFIWASFERGTDETVPNAIAKQFPGSRASIRAVITENLNERPGSGLYYRARRWLAKSDFFSPEEKEKILASDPPNEATSSLLEASMYPEP